MTKRKTNEPGGKMRENPGKSPSIIRKCLAAFLLIWYSLCMRKTRFSARIGKHLRHTRRMKDVTQEELAELLDVSVDWISRLERGVKLPNLKFLFRMAKALRLPMKDLLPK
jgi:DNA-binding XRE family transcriptional regulator